MSYFRMTDRKGCGEAAYILLGNEYPEALAVGAWVGEVELIGKLLSLFRARLRLWPCGPQQT
jgi:hypothetical protein